MAFGGNRSGGAGGTAGIPGGNGGAYAAFGGNRSGGAGGRGGITGSGGMMYGDRRNRDRERWGCEGVSILALVGARRASLRRRQRETEQPARHLESAPRLRLQPTLQDGATGRILSGLSLSRRVSRRVQLGQLRSGTRRKRVLLLLPSRQARSLRSARRGSDDGGSRLCREPARAHLSSFHVGHGQTHGHKVPGSLVCCWPWGTGSILAT